MNYHITRRFLMVGLLGVSSVACLASVVPAIGRWNDGVIAANRAQSCFVMDNPINAGETIGWRGVKVKAIVTGVDGKDSVKLIEKPLPIGSEICDRQGLTAIVGKDSQAIDLKQGQPEAILTILDSRKIPTQSASQPKSAPTKGN